jgi:hypothetical protein
MGVWLFLLASFLPSSIVLVLVVVLVLDLHARGISRVGSIDHGLFDPHHSNQRPRPRPRTIWDATASTSPNFGIWIAQLANASNGNGGKIPDVLGSLSGLTIQPDVTGARWRLALQRSHLNIVDICGHEISLGSDA